jgi:hypothetical protein
MVNAGIYQSSGFYSNTYIERNFPATEKFPSIAVRLQSGFIVFVWGVS